MDRHHPTATATALVDLVTSCLDEFARLHAPGLSLPRVFAGHPLGADARADLVFTLGLLTDCGVTEVAGRVPTDVIGELLWDVDGPGTDTFYSYRVAETVRRFGTFEHNTLLAGWPDEHRAAVAQACDTTSWIELLDTGLLPRNYAAVLTRCELARRELGLLDDGADQGPQHDQLAALLERARALVSPGVGCGMDDSTHGVGRFDIYSIDVWLFCETLAAELGAVWQQGMAGAVALADLVAQPDGAVVWGRSTGALSQALTVELSAVATELGGLDAAVQRRWAARGAEAADAMAGWFTGGAISAHQHRSTYGYRGPFRRMQMTWDILGKLAWAASQLAAVTADDERYTGDDLGPDEVWPNRDDHHRFSTDPPASVWSWRRGRLGLVIPFVGSTRSDYLPAPHSPGLYECAVDTEIACWAPLATIGSSRYSMAGRPDSIDVPAEGEVRARWERFERLGELDPPDQRRTLAGTGTQHWRADGRSLEMTLDLSFETVPTTLAITIPEVERRPLVVEATTGADEPLGVSMVDTAGIAEWRSFWHELPTVHEVDLEPAPAVNVSVRVTPVLRVASTADGHHYNASLYAPMAPYVRSGPSPLGPLGTRRVRLADVDVFHLHWPEWVAFADLDEHRRVIDQLQTAGTPVLWTAHNLTPHDKNPAVYDPIYQAWADAAHTVIHHTAWGRDRLMARYEFPAGTRHEVIPHGHFGDLYAEARMLDRAEIERDLGLAPCHLRIGIVGAPRDEKKVTGFIEGFTACDRDDLQLVAWSLEEGDARPADPRIPIADTYTLVPAAEYGRRLAVCDLLAMPFDPTGDMLATGTAADALGFGLPALVSDWGYLREALGASGIPCGHEPAAIAASLAALDDATVQAARAASAELASTMAWSAVAARTSAILEDLVLRW